MSLQILGIFEGGRPNVERIELQALAPVSLAYYVLIHTTYINSSAVASGAHPAFWFPPVRVEAGERIVLYTRGPSGLATSPGSLPRTFYWGLKQTIWNTPNDTAVLVQAVGWQTVARASPLFSSLNRIDA